MQEVLLEMKNIYKQFNGNYVLNGVNFSIYKGEVHALVGENGSGKSTLVNILSGMVEKDSGDIFLNGKRVDINTPKLAKNLGMGIVFQDYRLFNNLTVGENIFIGHEPTIDFGKFKIINWVKMHKEAKKILEYLNVNIDTKLSVNKLNHGYKKLIEIASVISNMPQILIMDEPTALLNDLEIEIFNKVVLDLKALGVSIIFISHQISEIKKIADRVTILKEGKEAVIIEKKDINFNTIIKTLSKGEIKDSYPKLDVNIGEEVLLVNNLSVKNKLNNISFSLREGEILGITGLSGSGTTDLAKVLFGALGKFNGKIYLRGRKFEAKNTEHAARNGIGYISSNKHNEGLIYQMSVSDNIISSNIEYVSKALFLKEKSINNIAMKYIKLLQLKVKSPNDKVKDLSGGTKKKVLLAKWLFKNSKVLIINEPTSGIDVPSKVDFYNIINETVRSGAAVIFISSDLPEILGMCDRIIVMNKGSIVKKMKKSEATKENILYYASGVNDN